MDNSNTWGIQHWGIKEFPKITFPKSDDGTVRKRTYLFVDFEMKDTEKGKSISREFVNQWNVTYGPDAAQRARV